MYFQPTLICALSDLISFHIRKKERKKSVIFLHDTAYHKTKSKLPLLVHMIFTMSGIFLPPPFSAPVHWPIRKKQKAWSLSNYMETLSKNTPKLSVSLIEASDWQISQQFILNRQLCFNFFFKFSPTEVNSGSNQLFSVPPSAFIPLSRNMDVTFLHICLCLALWLLAAIHSCLPLSCTRHVFRWQAEPSYRLQEYILHNQKTACDSC